VTQQQLFENMVHVTPHVPTNYNVVEEMLSDISFYTNIKILEPSAGNGHLINGIRQYLINNPDMMYPHIDMCEIDDDRHKHLMRTQCIFPNTRLVGKDFLELMPSVCGMYELDHIIHAFSLLREGGMLVSVVPRQYFDCHTANADAFNMILQTHLHCYKQLPLGSFLPFSNTPSYIIRIWK
jgi:hypothetical protein